jgi:hypothetical protein
LAGAQRFRFPFATFLCEPFPQQTYRPMMRDAGRQRLEFLDRLDLAHLFHQGLQRFNRHIFDFIGKEWLEFQLRHRKDRRPESTRTPRPKRRSRRVAGRQGRAR